MHSRVNGSPLERGFSRARGRSRHYKQTCLQVIKKFYSLIIKGLQKIKNRIFTVKESIKNDCFTALKDERERLCLARALPKTRSRAPPTRNDAEDGSAQGRHGKTRWRGVSVQSERQ